MNSNFFPLYEVEQGETNITYDPEAKKKQVPLSEWLKYMGKSRHLLKEENKEMLGEFEKEVERRWSILKAKHENPLL